MGKEVLDNIKFVQAKWYQPVKTGRHIQYIVIHSMQAPEKPDTAEGTARFFQKLPATRKASAHYCIDENSIVQCLQTRDVAYAAPGCNHNGIHLELAGYAEQTKTDWMDSKSVAIMKNAAWLCASVLIPKYQIPAIFINSGGLREGNEHTSIKGFTTHAEVSQAFHLSTHWDPGPGFPREQFLAWVKDAQEGILV